MNTNIQIFNNPKFGEVRVTEIDGKIYFVGNDVAKALGYASPKDAISRHCKGATFHRLPDNQGVIQDTKVIPEGDIYRLAAKSELPGAEDFESWIFDEVLPSIRKHGGYIASNADDTEELLVARALIVAQATIERSRQRVQILEGENDLLIKENKELAPKAEYTDTVLQSTSTFTSTQVSKELGMREAEQLHKRLHDMNVMFKQSGQWMLYARYCGLGYTENRTHYYTNKRTGEVETNIITVWTEKGRKFLHNLFKNENAA